MGVRADRSQYYSLIIMTSLIRISLAGEYIQFLWWSCGEQWKEVEMAGVCSDVYRYLCFGSCGSEVSVYVQ